MSISFNPDTSTQLTYSAFPYTISSNDNYATSNYVNQFWKKTGTTMYNTDLNNGRVGIGLTNPSGNFEVQDIYNYKMKIGHVGQWGANHLFCTEFLEF